MDTQAEKMLDAGLFDDVKSMERFLGQQSQAGVTVDRTRGIWVSVEFESYLKALGTGNASQ
jgi:tRNA dimethylallyltransferase